MLVAAPERAGAGAAGMCPCAAEVVIVHGFHGARMVWKRQGAAVGGEGAAVTGQVTMPP